MADVLTECAWAAVKTKGTYLSAYYRQVMSRQGKQKAVIALKPADSGDRLASVVHGRALRRSWRRRGERGQPGTQQRRRAIRQLEALGLTVTVQPGRARTRRV